MACASVLAFFAVDKWSIVAAVLAVAAALGWLVSWVEWQSTHRQIGIFEEHLSRAQIFVGGRGREVRLTSDPTDNDCGDAVGRWLRSPLPPS